ncbi:MAG: CpsD/CapB family tyrosine-protein kinase [Planctomycetota bacterium]
MGRIADAIKKADSERREKLRVGVIGSTRPDGDLRTGAALSSQGIPLSSANGSVQVISPPSRQAMATVTLPSLSWDVHPSVVAIHDRSGSITEQYRAVRTWLLSRLNPGERSCIALTSSVPREGKSVTTANLAAVLAEVRHMNVLAVDCDFRQSSLAKLFKLPAGPGLADVLAGRANLNEAITKTPLGNLSILPAGNAGDLNTTELLHSRMTSRVFDEIRERYHFILVDTPPVQRSSDVGVIGTLCTGVVVVVRMHETASHLVRQSVRWLQSNNLSVMGCVAAGCRANVDRYAYEAEDRDE